MGELWGIAFYKKTINTAYPLSRDGQCLLSFFFQTVKKIIVRPLLQMQ